MSECEHEGISAQCKYCGIPCYFTNSDQYAENADHIPLDDENGGAFICSQCYDSIYGEESSEEE